MRTVFVMVLAAVGVSACGVMHFGGGGQCMAPTSREAEITKRVWR